MRYELYVIDTETTGLRVGEHFPVEISLYRLSTDEQKTWHLKPLRTDNIEQDALRITGLKLEDLLGQTKEGRALYQTPAKVLIEIENWVAQDDRPSNERLLVAQNAAFDKGMMEALWEKCESSGTYPFNTRYSLDTMNLQLALDLARGEEGEGYNLAKLAKRHSVKNEKAHSAAADCRCCAEVFRKQISAFGSLAGTS